MGGIVKYRVQHMHGRGPVSVNFSFQIKSRGVDFGWETPVNQADPNKGSHVGRWRRVEEYFR